MISTETNKSKLKLPVKYPVITSYTNHAHIVSILEAYDYTQDWLMSNYILIYCRKNLFNHCWGDFYFPMTYNIRSPECCRYLLKQKLHPETITSMNIKIIDFLCRSIENHNYVHIMLDSFYIKGTFYYNSVHGYHDMLLYGFDKNSEIFYCADFLFSPSGSYTFAEISFEDLMHSYDNCDPDSPNNYLYGLIYLYKLTDKDRASYVFDFQNIIHSLRAYYDCKQLENWEFYHSDDASCVVFGLDVYDELEQYVRDTIKQQQAGFGMRIFYVIYDHKRIMVKRLQYLKECYPQLNDLINPLLHTYKKLESLGHAITMILLKSHIRKSINIVEGIIEYLHEIKHLEGTALKEFLTQYDEQYSSQEIH